MWAHSSSLHLALGSFIHILIELTLNSDAFNFSNNVKFHFHVTRLTDVWVKSIALSVQNVIILRNWRAKQAIDEIFLYTLCGGWAEINHERPKSFKWA